jgi:dephospho-CoA kinase
MTIHTLSVGLTGGIGSGKSLVADLFAAQGAAVIDTDQIAHQLTAAGGLAMPLIRQSFGDVFLTTEGALDRTRMRERVFTDAAARQQLEKILHPLIAQETEAAAQRSEGAYLMFVVPLLVESGRWVDRVDRVLVVDCPEAMQIARVQARNQFSVAQVEAIMATQVQRSERLAVAHDVIVNDGPRDAVAAAVERLHREYLSLAAKKRAGGL